MLEGAFTGVGCNGPFRIIRYLAADRWQRCNSIQSWYALHIMHFMYRATNGSTAEIFRLHQERYETNDNETGQFTIWELLANRHYACHPRRFKTANLIEAILNEVENRHERIARAIALNKRFTHWSCVSWRQVTAILSPRISDPKWNGFSPTCHICMLFQATEVTAPTDFRICPDDGLDNAMEYLINISVKYGSQSVQVLQVRDTISNDFPWMYEQELSTITKLARIFCQPD